MYLCIQTMIQNQKKLDWALRLRNSGCYKPHPLEFLYKPISRAHSTCEMVRQKKVLRQYFSWDFWIMKVEGCTYKKVSKKFLLQFFPS